jgi:acyl-phosphate glycerol 3-phosphate acyltransferase
MAITEPSLAFTAALVLLAYLIGSVPFAVVVSKLMGLQDPRSYGSKNPGATNVLRTGNKTAAALTLLGDAAKGWFAIWLAERLAPGIAPAGLALVALAAFVGHLYPVFLRFKGGKGVATALGVLVAIQPWLAVATAATWLIVSGIAGGGVLCARLLRLWLGAGVAREAGAGRGAGSDRRTAVLPSPRQHRAPGARHGKQDRRRQEEIIPSCRRVDKGTGRDQAISARSQRGFTVKLCASASSVASPALTRSAAAKAIIAPLSVHSSSGGK